MQERLFATAAVLLGRYDGGVGCCCLVLALRSSEPEVVLIGGVANEKPGSRSGRIGRRSSLRSAVDDAIAALACFNHQRPWFVDRHRLICSAR